MNLGKKQRGEVLKVSLFKIEKVDIYSICKIVVTLIIL